MTTLIKITVIAITAFVSTLSAQNFQGIATYKTQRQMDIEMDSTRVNPEMQKRMMEMMKKQFQRTFHLNFSKEASTYKHEEQQDKP